VNTKSVTIKFYMKPSDLPYVEMPSEWICDGKTRSLWP